MNLLLNNKLHSPMSDADFTKKKNSFLGLGLQLPPKEQNHTAFSHFFFSVLHAALWFNKMWFRPYQWALGSTRISPTHLHAAKLGCGHTGQTRTALATQLKLAFRSRGFQNLVSFTSFPYSLPIFTAVFQASNHLTRNNIRADMYRHTENRESR